MARRYENEREDEIIGNEKKKANNIRKEIEENQ